MFSAKQVVWLLIRQQEELDEQQSQALPGLCQVSLEIEKAYQLAQNFCSVLRQRQGEERPEGWLQEAKQSTLPGLQQFVADNQWDKAAVQAGLSLPYSTRPVEGHINRIASN